MDSRETCSLVSAIVYYFRQCCLFEVREVWETLWIFKVARWTHNRWPKINKSPTVSNGLGASSFEIWTANLAVAYRGHPNKLVELRLWRFKLYAPKNPTFRCGHFWLGISFFNALIFLWKKSKPVGYIQEHCIGKLGKIRSKLKLLFGVYYWFLIDFVAKGQWLVWV